MINARKQIYNALKTINTNVKQMRPEGDLTFPLITYAEITNVNINKREDRIEYQIDAYTQSMTDCWTLTQQIDEVMTGLGWHRTYITPDTQARQGKDFYKKSINYAARVDILWNNITGGY